MSSPFRKQNECCFFFNQTEISKAPTKRPRKVLDDPNLNRKIGKFNAGSSDNFSEDGDIAIKSLSERLAQLTTVPHSASSLHSGSGRSSLGPNAFTDTRLQAIRFLTEDIIKELEFLLVAYSNAHVQPALEGSIIYEFHSDWTDLTEHCKYSNFPMWRTKNGRESQMKKTADGEKKNQQRNGSSMLGGRRSGSGGDDASSGKNDNGTERSNSSRKSYFKANKQVIKLSSINESGKRKNSSNVKSTDLDQLKQYPNQISNPIRRRSSVTNKPMSPKIQIPEAPSRLTQSTNNSTGCLVNYQLSNFTYKDKGWTVMSSNSEDVFLDNERKILASFRNSLESMYILFSS